MKTKGKLERLDGVVYTNADPQYERKLDDLHGATCFELHSNAIE